jgi:predicted phage gp36 major capsid-like protein
MSGQQIPADLIELKRRFIDVQADQAQFAVTLPSSMAIATGQASLTDEQQSAWRQIQTELTELAVQIHRHPALTALGPVDRDALDRAATKTAKDTIDAAEQ